MKLYYQMKVAFFMIAIFIINFTDLTAQNIVHPTVTKKPVGFAISKPLRDNPVVSYSDYRKKRGSY